MDLIVSPPIRFTGRHLEGDKVDKISRKIGDLGSIFSDKAAHATMPPEQVVYEVESFFPVAHNTEGGLFYGITFIKPGMVGSEYFMTKGHFHTIRNRAEIYITMEGEGMLILMDEDRHTWAEKMSPGSVHYIHAGIAHRTANTTNTTLSFGAIWPADAGHDYHTIDKEGFSKILINRDNVPTLVDRK